MDSLKNFVHLHVHSHYSIYDALSSVKNLVDKAIECDMPGMALTDHGNMFGIKDFYDYVNKLNKDREAKGIDPFKPIFGCELYVAKNGNKDHKAFPKDLGGYHLTVLAKNERGYRNLIKIVSNSWTDGFFMRPRTDRKELEKYHEGLIVLSGCLAGEVPVKLLNDDIIGSRAAIEWYHGVFGDDYYLELERHEVKDSSIIANREKYKCQEKVNRQLKQLAKEYGIKVVCTNDVHFTNQDQAEAHDRLICLGTGKELEEPNRTYYSKQEWLKTYDEMATVFEDIPEALSNTLDILNKIELYSIDHKPVLPAFPIPTEFGTEKEWREKYTEESLLHDFSCDENGEKCMSEIECIERINRLGGINELYQIMLEHDYLEKISMDRAYQIYGKPLPSDVEDRLRFELHVIKTKGFSRYFLIMQDLVNSLRSNYGVMVGPGRGSAAGCLVSFCLGITRIDPLKYDLLFERFINLNRDVLPDIDIDFDEEGRFLAHKYLEDKYGKDCCAHIVTFATMYPQRVIKNVAKLEKIPDSVSESLCEEIPPYLPNWMRMNMTNICLTVPAFKKAEKSRKPAMRNLIKYSKILEGAICGTGVHACGFVVSQGPISDWAPVFTTDNPDEKGNSIVCTQYDGMRIESTGLVKMDFLGLKTLSEIKNALLNIKYSRGIDINLDEIPIDDPNTFELYQQGNTIGVFQFESSSMRKWLRYLLPTVFDDLVALNALYRPGPMDYIPAFVSKKNGRDKITYDIPCMEKYLKDTYGVTVYQEQIMMLSRLLADFTREESDILRKAIGKRKKDIIDVLKPQFMERGKKNGHNPRLLEKIWKDWEHFGCYAFNKSHAVCYTWIAYQTAYLKANYPVEYMAAIMESRKSQKSELNILIKECKRMGLCLVSSDVIDKDNIKIVGDVIHLGKKLMK